MESRKGHLVVFFPPALAVEGMESVPSVCVCLSVSALTAERFEVRTQNHDFHLGN